MVLDSGFYEISRTAGGEETDYFAIADPIAVSFSILAFKEHAKFLNVEVFTEAHGMDTVLSFQTPEGVTHELVLRPLKD